MMLIAANNLVNQSGESMYRLHMTRKTVTPSMAVAIPVELVALMMHKADIPTPVAVTHQGTV